MNSKAVHDESLYLQKEMKEAKKLLEQLDIKKLRP